MSSPKRTARKLKTTPTAKKIAAAAPKKRAGKRNDPERVAQIIAGLERLYPDAHCELDFTSPFQLLVATILSAQSTDKTVNTITPALFARFPDAAALAAANIADVEALVKSSGFFRQKAKNIVGAAKAIVHDHGEVPRSMEALTRLPGVARKTANVVLGSAYHMEEGIAVDTHVTRLSGRLGLTRETDPVKIEQDLLKIFPREKWTQLGHQIIWHGRRLCHARKPKCDECALAPYCPSAGSEPG